MQTDVYADILFAVNFSMDFLCVYVTAGVLHVRLKAWRGVLSAALGGAYSVLALFLDVSWFAAVALDIAVCILMNFAAFGKRGNALKVLLYSAVYFGISALLGGVMTALYSLLNKGNYDYGTIPDGPGVWAFAALAAAGSGVTALLGRFFRRQSAKTECDIRILFGGRTLELRALCDSGNLLRDPITGRPVIIIDRGRANELLTGAELEMLEDTSEITANSQIRSRIRLIPANSATGSGMLAAFRPDGVQILTKKGVTDAEALVAVSDIRKNSNIDAIVPSQLI